MDDGGYSDLHAAAQDGDLVRVRALLAAGEPPATFDEISKTPLHYAAEGGHLDVMRALLEAGADVDAIDRDRIGNTALRSVAGSCPLAVAVLLVEAGADPRIPGWMLLRALDKAEERKDEEGRQVYALLLSAAERLDRG